MGFREFSVGLKRRLVTFYVESWRRRFGINVKLYSLGQNLWRCNILQMLLNFQLQCLIEFFLENIEWHIDNVCQNSLV